MTTDPVARKATMGSRLQSEKQKGGAVASFSIVGKNGALTQPLETDVLLGRGKPFQEHPGNKLMHQLANEVKEAYRRAPRPAKRVIATKIYHILTKKGTRFLKRDENYSSRAWIEVTPEIAIEKLCHVLRHRSRIGGKKAPKSTQSEDAVAPNLMSGYFNALERSNARQPQILNPNLLLENQGLYPPNLSHANNLAVVSQLPLLMNPLLIPSAPVLQNPLLGSAHGLSGIGSVYNSPALDELTLEARLAARSVLLQSELGGLLQAGVGRIPGGLYSGLNVNTGLKKSPK